MLIFYILKKQNYSNICFNIIEREYHDKSFYDLIAIRINSSVRYLEGIDSREEKYSLRVLGETIENINCYTKELTLGNT